MKKLILMLMLAAPVAAFAQKFGVVNTQSIMQSLPDVAKANGELQALQKEKENALKALQDEGNRKYQEYEKSKSTMAPTKQKEVEDELNALSQKIQEAAQAAQTEIQKKSNELMEPIVTKVRNAISNVGKAGGYTYIFEDGVAIYTGDAVKDVTADVKAEISKLK